jgi:hypothetical protein
MTPEPILCCHRIAPLDSVRQDRFVIAPEALAQHLGLLERWIDAQGAKVSPTSEPFVTRAHRRVHRARARERQVIDARARRRTAERRGAEPQELSA